MSTQSTSSKVGHGLARVLQIKLDYRNEMGRDNDSRITRGESVFSVDSADDYVEDEPTVADWFTEHFPTGRQVLQYVHSLFPFTMWIAHYNVQWLIGDLIAGITVGAVVVPQGMAYAQLATLPVQFGLYSSFMGVLIYWFFATSKDITIGPVAVLSTVTGNVILQVQAQYGDRWAPEDIGSALAIIGGAIVCFLGVTRLGWLVDFISLASISAFMTGSALNIAVGQVPNLMGITGFSTRSSTYLVVINILKHLGRTKIDAAMGLTALFLLYAIRSVCVYGGRRYPKLRKTFFYASTLRTVFVILLYTLVSWLANRHHRDKPIFKILGHVPRGFKDAKVPTVDTDLISAFAGQLPATVIVLVIEHISISKSFGRVNNYQINPSQELVAIGVTNLLGPFLGAYPATGSFSRTAIKSKAGVRTPLAGLITAIVVLLAIYALPAVFFYISQASLSAVIIHAVGDLITPPNTVYQFWRVSPLEVIIFFAGVIVTVFSTIEDGVYVTIASSAALLLWRVFKARGRFLGKVKVHSVVGDHLIQGHEPKYGTTSGSLRKGTTGDDKSVQAREVFLPLDHRDGSNPQIELRAPYPGVFIYRFSEGYNYPNANHYLDYMVHVIFQQCRRTNPMSYGRKGDRPWNDPGPLRGKDLDKEDNRPTLKAVVLDLSSVNNVDITSVQHLIDVRNQLDRYASPDVVEWHFAHINNRWTKRALASAGFGYPAINSQDGGFERWKPIFSVAELGGEDSAAQAAENGFNRAERKRRTQSQSLANNGQDKDIENDQIQRHDVNASSEGDRSSTPDSINKTLKTSQAYAPQSNRVAVTQGINRPLFHTDLTGALQSAVANIQRYGEGRPAVPSREVIDGPVTI